MKKILFVVTAVFLLFAFTCKTTVESAYYPPLDGQLDPFRQAALLSKTVNMGDYLECPPPEGSWRNGAKIREYFFKLIKQKGFSAVRIPIRFSAYAGASRPYTISETFFKRIDQVTNWALKYSLAVIIDLHHFEELMNDPYNQKPRLLSIWRQIAQRYKNYPDTLFLEILNEPSNNLTPDLWNDFLYECLVEIRQIDDHHTVIIGCADWCQVQGLDRLVVPRQETNAIVTFHYYHPHLFTHQGAPWGGADAATTGIVFPGPPKTPVVPAAGVAEWVKYWIADYNKITDPERNPCGYKLIRDEIGKAAQWGRTHKRPLFMGEFGVVPYADMRSRTNWTEFVRTQLEAEGILWAYWDFSGNLKVYDIAKGAWVRELIRALGL